MTGRGLNGGDLCKVRNRSDLRWTFL